MSETMLPLRALVAPPLARMLACSRRAEGSYLSYIRSVVGGGSDPSGKRTGRGSRINDGYSWALAAWAEIADREPVVTHQRRKGHMERVRTRPWRDGKTSAWIYLETRAQDKLWGGAARQMLADLERRGITREAEPCLVCGEPVHGLLCKVCGGTAAEPDQTCGRCG